MGNSEYKTKQAVTSSLSSQLREESFCQTRVFRSLSDTVEVSITRGVDETGAINQKEYRFEAVLRGGVDPYNVDDDGRPLPGTIQFDRPETFEQFAVNVGYALGVSISPLTVDPRVELSSAEVVVAQDLRNRMEEKPVSERTRIGHEHMKLVELLELVEETYQDLIADRSPMGMLNDDIRLRTKIAMDAIRCERVKGT